MIILPAIDILGGSCVRLVRGEYGTASKVAADPFETIKAFDDAGAEYIHLVDLDGAKDAAMVNSALICALAARTSVPCEVGGGIRTLEAVEYYLSRGISRVILGSVALSKPELVREAAKKYGAKIAVGIDAKNGFVSTSGWLETSRTDYIAFARLMADCGVGTIIFTDIDRDGTLGGPNLDQLSALNEAVGGKTNITASGGIKDMGDIKALCELGIYGAIAGKSIYSGTLELSEAVSYTKSHPNAEKRRRGER